MESMEKYARRHGLDRLLSPDLFEALMPLRREPGELIIRSGRPAAEPPLPGRGQRQGLQQHGQRPEHPRLLLPALRRPGRGRALLFGALRAERRGPEPDALPRLVRRGDQEGCGAQRPAFHVPLRPPRREADRSRRSGVHQSPLPRGESSRELSPSLDGRRGQGYSAPTTWESSPTSSGRAIASSAEWCATSATRAFWKTGEAASASSIRPS